MTAIILYSVALMFLLLSFIKDKEKTKKSIFKAWTSFAKLLPSIFAILLFVGISLAVVDPKTISILIGSKSGIWGIFFALVVGSIAVIPSFVAFPLGGTLLKAGAGYPQVAALVSTIMAVGIVTLPAEIKYFNKTTAILRITFSFLIAVIFTFVIGQVM